MIKERVTEANRFRNTLELKLRFICVPGRIIYNILLSAVLPAESSPPLSAPADFFIARSEVGDDPRDLFTVTILRLPLPVPNPLPVVDPAHQIPPRATIAIACIARQAEKFANVGSNIRATRIAFGCEPNVHRSDLAKAEQNACRCI